jgi:hypothetical protein
MTSRTIEDLEYKMKFIRKTPQDSLTQLFLDMCDSGIELYIQSELVKNPNQTPTEIMKKYHLRKLSNLR